ncbi:class I SAM-dependent methyltransferase [Methylobacterium durans]|uniref:class I SAM-dependent methyltransferase n=1 Tax=Methylobacterium durans TaxID=2202825 RepID=UPI0013A59C89|nr:methyltransferase domain-containing protein [Methylobacterium durans]
MRLLGDQPSISARMQLAAALATVPGGKLCDVGGSTSAYLLVAHVLGTHVTIVDTMPYVDGGPGAVPGFEAEVRRRLTLFEKLGLAVRRTDVFETGLPADHFDVAVAFETIEHFAHSPKPVLEAMVKSLHPGGRLCLSTPNIARIEMRLRLLAGRTVHERLVPFFHDGNPFLGHHREYTLNEFEALPDLLGLKAVAVFAANVTYESRKRKTAAQHFLINLEERYGLGDLLLPPTWRKHVWLEAMKQR